MLVFGCLFSWLGDVMDGWMDDDVYVGGSDGCVDATLGSPRLFRRVRTVHPSQINMCFHKIFYRERFSYKITNHVTDD